MLIRAYLFVYKFFENLIAFIESLKFLKELNKLKVFKTNNTEDILRVISTFIMIKVSHYPNTVKMSRDIIGSTALLLALIDLYLEGHSEKHLEQLLEVLKNEFIKREIN